MTGEQARTHGAGIAEVLLTLGRVDWGKYTKTRDEVYDLVRVAQFDRDDAKASEALRTLQAICEVVRRP